MANLNALNVEREILAGIHSGKYRTGRSIGDARIRAVNRLREKGLLDYRIEMGVNDSGGIVATVGEVWLTIKGERYMGASV